MKVVQITPGAGGMYCGNCLRDNALVAEMRRLGHDTLMVPLYLPLTLDEADQSAGTPVFFGGVNVYLDQILPWYRRAPHWLRRPFSASWLLRWAGERAAKTRPEQVGELTLSMLRGEAGNQNRDLDDLIAWLGTHVQPDVILLSNALLLGMARRLHTELGARVACLLAGEDNFLDSLDPHCRSEAWRIVTERAAEIDGFLSPSRYYADVMMARLKLPAERVRVVPSGISLSGYDRLPARPTARNAESRPKVIGFFARMCREKGLDLLVDAFIHLRRRNRLGPVRLKVGGGCGAADLPYVDGLKRKLHDAGFERETEFFPNLPREEKILFLSNLDLLSVPARYSEAFGLYLLESMAAGTPVVQPAAAAFPELIDDTGGGILYTPHDAPTLALAMEGLLSDPDKRENLGRQGRETVLRRYSAAVMAEQTLEALRDWLHTSSPMQTAQASSS